MLRVLIFCGIVCPMAHLNADDVLPLTLGQTFGLLEVQNLRVLADEEFVEDSRRAVFTQRSGLLPRFRFDATQIRTQFANIGRGVGNIPRTPPVNRYEGKFGGQMAVFDPVTFANYRLAKLDYEISKLDHESLLQGFLAETAFGYFTHLRNQRRREVIEANIERDKVLLDLAESQMRAGVATQIDVTRAEVQLASDNKDRLQQDTLVIESALRLKSLLNLDLDTRIDLADEALQEHRPPPTVDFDISRILALRPDHQAAARVLNRNRFALKAARWESLPTVNLFGEFGSATSRIFDDREEETWTAGLTLSIPIFDGFRIRENKRRAEILIRRQELLVEDLVKEVGAAYRFVLADRLSRFQQIGITRKKVALSEQELELARTRFKEGVADNSDVVEAQAKLAEASDELVEAIYQFNLSRLQLARIRGDARLVLSD